MNVGKTLYRYHNFDLLRSVAMFLGIVIHSPLIFVDKSVGKEVLPEIDYLPEIEPWIGVILLWINSWRMPTFFLMAGFMSILVIERTTPQFFFRDRLLRVGGTMVLFGFFLIGYPSGNYLHIGHFWFLYCLIVIIAIFVLSSFFTNVLDINRIKPIISWTFFRPWRMIIFLFVFILIRLLCSFPYNGNLPLPDSYSKFFIGTFVYYGFWFYAGVGLYFAKSQIVEFSSFRVISLLGLLSIFSLMLAAFVIDTYDFFVTPETLNESFTLRFFLMNMYWACTTAFWTFFLTLLVHKIFNRSSIIINWLVELSYPIYIFHLVIAIVVAAELFRAGYSQSEVFLMTIPLTFAGCLVSYYVLVKFTPLNWLVNGYRKSWLKIPMIFGK